MSLYGLQLKSLQQGSEDFRKGLREAASIGHEPDQCQEGVRLSEWGWSPAARWKARLGAQEMGVPAYIQVGEQAVYSVSITDQAKPELQGIRESPACCSWMCTSIIRP